MKMNRILAVLLSALLMLSMMAGCSAPAAETAPAPEAAPATAAYTAGAYEGSSVGRNGPITVSLTLSETSIVSVEVVTHEETPGICEPAIERIPADIVTYQSLGVDAISGCTETSNGIIRAVADACQKAGADVSALMTVEVNKVAGETIVREADVVVIGAGGAGMSAAYAAAQTGASVIVVEKTASVGGNTLASGGVYNCVDPDRQLQVEMKESEVEAIENLLALPAKCDEMAQWQAIVKKEFDEHIQSGNTGLFDSITLHKLQTYVGGDYIGKVNLIETLCENAPAGYELLTSLGGEWSNGISAAVGATWSRSHTPTVSYGTTGANAVIPFYKAYIAEGGEVLTEYRAQELIMDGDTVVGVRGITTDNGTPFEITANNGVVIATGGFGANVEMRQQYNTMWANLGPEVLTSNVAGATGDGILMAQAAGANVVGMEWIQMVTTGLKTSFTGAINDCIFVNANGERFVREDGRRDDLSAACLEQPGAYYWKVIDAHLAIDQLNGYTYNGFVIDDLVDNELVYKGETLEDLANQLGMDYAVLQATVDTFNKSVDGEADPFGRAVFNEKLNKGPFYAAKGVAKVHHTMGGIEINSNAQVLRADGSTINGLYAAGETTGGIHGTNRLGGNAIADVIVFGRIAGTNAAK